MQKGYSKYFSRIQWSPETFVCFNLVLHLRKKKTEHFQIFLLYQETERDFLILNTEGIRKGIEDKRNFIISFIKHCTTLISVYF
jgi:hypothetical protein